MENSVSGLVERVTYFSEQNGYCVLRVKAKNQRDLITVTGTVASISAGEFVAAQGAWINDKHYGLQFRSNQIRVVQPSTQEGMEKYLASGLVKGVGAVYAKKLVSTFGTDVFNVIEGTPERLFEVAGIGKKRQQTIVNAWHEQKSIREIMVFLQSHGVGTLRAVRIYKTYGNDAIAKVSQNPYCLAQDINGIGFKIADTIAMRIGIPHDSLLRAQAGVVYILQLASSDGDCAMLKADLSDKTMSLLGVEKEIVEQAIEHELQAEHIIKEALDDHVVIFITPLQRAEVGVSQHLFRLSQSLLSWHNIDADSAVAWVEKETNICLSSSQKQAIKTVLHEKVSVITGGPGVGKTTIINSITKIFFRKQFQIMCCAPTGRAAKRLSESTGMVAKTIHRLLEFSPEIMGFKRNAKNQLVTDCLIIDEVSMVDIVLMNQLLKAVPTQAIVLFVGDVDQLPSVGPGLVLADIIRSEVIPVVRLTEIFRQAKSSHIIINAHRINQGYIPQNNPQQTLSDFYYIQVKVESIQQTLKQLVSERIPKRFNLHPIRDIQVITPMNRGAIGATALNEVLQSLLNPLQENQPYVRRYATQFREHDKVIQMVNNYDKEVFNGDIGFIQCIDSHEEKVSIEFDERLVDYEYAELDELALAYATTVHKAQGSEYPCVVIPVCMQHYMLLQKNLLYTAMTRGKRLVILLGEYKALIMAVKNNKSNLRLTHLCQRLQLKI